MQRLLQIGAAGLAAMAIGLVALPGCLGPAGSGGANDEGEVSGTEAAAPQENVGTAAQALTTCSNTARAKHSNKCFDIQGASTASGARLIQYSCHSGSNQQFQAVALDGGDYMLVARHSGMCLDVQGSSTANGALIIQYPCHGERNQRFRLNPAGAGYSNIVAKHSGKCLDVQGASTADVAPIIQYACHGGDNQKFLVN